MTIRDSFLAFAEKNHLPVKENKKMVQVFFLSKSAEKRGNMALMPCA